MERLDILLFDRLAVNKSHVRPRDSLADCLGVVRIKNCGAISLTR
jgi:hypothetical protein